MKVALDKSVAVASLVLGLASAQKVCSGVRGGSDATVVAKGFYAYVLTAASGPRGLVVDSAGNLLVLERGTGVTALKLAEAGGCVTVASKSTVVPKGQVRSGERFLALHC